MYRFYCEICGWKKITDGSDVNQLYEIKTSPIPGGIPKLNQETSKITYCKSINQARRFRCPKCGRCVIPKKIDNPQESVDRKTDFQERKGHEQDWANGREGSS
jgi:hypothetical protein